MKSKPHAAHCGTLRVVHDDGRVEAALELCGDYVLKTDHGINGPELWQLYMTPEAV